MKKVVYQGIEGSFSHQTTVRLGYESQGLPSFREVYEAVEKGEADLGLLPIENTLAGTIYETIDLLSEGSLHIVGEVDTRVEHSLLALSSLSEIRKVLSHPKALAQTKRFFEAHPWMEAVAHYDTAGAAADVAKSGDPTLAAIAHCTAADIYGLQVLAEGIQDHAENYTRFFLISKTPTTGKKGSLCFTLEHRAGSLAELLEVLARHGINLTYIVSRPLIGKPFEYLFYIDLEMTGPIPIDILKTQTLKFLGTYETVEAVSHWRH